MALAFAVAILACARSSPGAQPADWDTITVPGGTAAFRCVAGLPERVPRARLLVDLGLRFADSGPEDPLGARLAAYATRLAAINARVAAMGGNEISLDDLAHRKDVDGLLSDLGIVVHRQDGTATAEPRGRLEPEAERFRTCLLGSSDDVARRLSAHERVTILPKADDVPLPVSARAWSALTNPDARLPLFLAIVADRGALVQYAALASLDRETLGALAQPSAWRQVSHGSRLLALYGGAFRIQNGTVDVPGGTSLAPAWEALVGQRTTQPVEFLSALLRTEKGRLAKFYATLDTFGPVRMRALLSERDAINHLYRLHQGWERFVPARPLGGPDFGVLTAAADIAIKADGSPLGPGSRRFWRVVSQLRKLPEHPDRLLKEEDLQPVTIGWLLDTVFGDPVYARENFAAVSFTQRVFPSAEVLPAVVVAAIGRKQFPALSVSLERMGIHDPQIYADLARSANRLHEGSNEIVGTRLRQWQSAVGLVETLRRTGAIDVPQAASTLAALAAWEPRPKGAFARAFGAWVDTSIRPLVTAPTDNTSSEQVELEQSLYQFMSGPLRQAETRITWEGLTYSVDLASVYARRARAIAALEPRGSLDDVLAVIAVARASEAAVNPEALSAAVSNLRSRLPHFEQPLPRVPWVRPGAPIQPAEILKGALKDFENPRADRDLSTVRRTAQTLWPLADELLADALPAVLYTARLGAAVGPPEKYADLWRRHDLGLGNQSDAMRTLIPWLIPQESEQPGGGVGVSGAFVGIDLALGRALLRQIPGGPPPAGVEVPPQLTAAIALSVALQAAGAGRDGAAGGDLRPIADAIERGRKRWASILDAAGSSDARWPGALRLNSVAWMKNHEAAAIEGEVSLAELFALPLAGGDATQEVFFGVPFAGRYGCWCLEFTPRLSMLGTGVWRLYGVISDLSLRVAELLADLRLPSVLLPAVLAAAFDDLAIRIDTVHAADWHAVSDAVRLLSKDRLEQLVFSLVATRELTVTTPSGKLP